MANSEGHSSVDSAEALGFAIENVDKLTGELGNAGAFDRTDIHDPQQQLDYKRGKIESDHEGLRGALGSAYSKLGLQHSYQSEMDELTSAQDYSAAGDTKSAQDLSRHQEQNRLQQFRSQINAAVAGESKSDFERQRESIEQTYQEQLQAADQVANGGTFSSQGFKSKAEANAYAQHLRDAAGAIHTAESDKSWAARAGQLQIGQGRLDVLKQAAAGDMTGAARTALGNQFDSEQLALDPNDKERQQQVAKIRQQAIANFDANAARQSKFHAAQSDDRIAGLHEEAKDAQLRAAGKNDEASISALNFSTQQSVRSLQEQADAEGDSTKKAQLLQEVAAAAEAGKAERDAMQKTLQRTNTQTQSLAGSSSKPPASDSATHNNAFPGNLVDVSKRLDDAAGKLEKAVSRIKSLSVVKD